MENYDNNNGKGASYEKKRKLIIEHARLAAQFAANHDRDIEREITDKLREIEEELTLSAHQIAKLAIEIYEKQY